MNVLWETRAIHESFDAGAMYSLPVRKFIAAAIEVALQGSGRDSESARADACPEATEVSVRELQDWRDRGALGWATVFVSRPMVWPCNLPTYTCLPTDCRPDRPVSQISC
jgi:hypothetical protein